MLYNKDAGEPRSVKQVRRMNQDERRLYLIEELLKERPEGREIGLPTGKEEQKRLLRALFNIRPPRPAPQAFLDVQDAYLREETRQKASRTPPTSRWCRRAYTSGRATLPR